MGETPQLFPVLWGLWAFYLCGRSSRRRGSWRSSSCIWLRASRLSSSLCGPITRWDYFVYAWRVYFSPSAPGARYCPLRPPAAPLPCLSLGGQDPGVACLIYVAWTLWLLGYPDQALKRSHEAVTLAQELSHPHSLAWALNGAAMFHQLRRERQAHPRAGRGTI